MLTCKIDFNDFTNKLSNKYPYLEILHMSSMDSYKGIVDYYYKKHGRRNIECFCKICGSFTRRQSSSMLELGCWRYDGLGIKKWNSYN